MLLRSRTNAIVAPNAFDFIREGATVGVLGTISYIALSASTTGWMIVGVLIGFMAITTFINMMTSFF